MPAERRQDVRHRIQRPAYASIAEGSGGLILDASERGLTIQSDATVPVCTWVKVKLDLMNRGACIITAARVAWSDGRGRVGIEFLDLSPETCGQLQEWLYSQPKANRVESVCALETVHEEATAAESSVDALLASAAERAVLLTGAHGAAIALIDGDDIRCRAAAGEIAPPVGTRIDSQSGLTGACLRSGHAMRCGSTDSDPQVDRESCRSLGISSVIAAPVVHGGSVVGLVEVFSRQPHAFDNSDCYALERLAETVADLVAANGALGQPWGKLRSEPALTTGAALQSAEVVAERSASPVGVASPYSSDAPATVAGDESSPLSGLLLPAGYEFSLAEKLMLHQRAVRLSLAGILLAVGLWLSFGTPWQWRSNAPPPTATNLQLAGREQTSSSRSIPSATTLMTHDSLEEVRRRAERGDQNAELELGAAYASGQNNAENYTQAVKWLTRSANHGNVTAAAALGAFYWAGRGVTPGYVDAYMWSAIAEAEGDEASSYRVAILQSRMSPIELAEARRRAAAWLRTHSKQIALKRDAPTPR